MIHIQYDGYTITDDDELQLFSIFEQKLFNSLQPPLTVFADATMYFE